VLITIYSKPGCHLCDEMKAVVQRACANDTSIVLEEIDISTDPELMRRYEIEIPVLMVDGKKAAKYRITETEIDRILRSRFRVRRTSDPEP
jgi:glutaredoxin